MEKKYKLIKVKEKQTSFQLQVGHRNCATGSSEHIYTRPRSQIRTGQQV